MASPNSLASAQSQITLRVEADARLRIMRQVLLYGTFGLLLFGPLAFGAVEPWAIFTLQVGAISLLLVWTARQVISKQLDVVANALYWPMLVLALLVGIQIIFNLSAYRYETISSALLYSTYAIMAFLAVQTLRRTSEVTIMAWALSAYGLAVAPFALVQSFSSNGKLYWIRVPRAGGWIYGPYVNHNHYAGLMEMLFPVPLVIALTHHLRGNRKYVPAFAAVVMVTSIFLSGSRGGMVAFLAQMIVLGILLGMRKSRRTALTTGAVLAIATVLMLWVGGEGLISRITSIHSEAKAELEGGLRLAVDRDGLKMFLRKPILGWGLGTFPVVYPEFRSFFTDAFINEAHNDYVQLLVETGGLGFGVVLWFFVLLYRHSTKKLGDWTWDINGTVAVATLLGCVGILVHSFVDFNLQIPANAALFYALSTIAATDTRFGAHRRLHRPRSSVELPPSAGAL